MLAAPRAASIVDGNKSPESGVDRPQMVGDVTGSHQWRASGMTAKIHQAAHGKSHDVRRFKFTIGTEKTEAANRREYRAGLIALRESKPKPISSRYPAGLSWIITSALAKRSRSVCRSPSDSRSRTMPRLLV